MAPSLLSSAATPGFTDATSPIVEKLRRALTAIFQSICGGLQKSYDAQRLLGLDAKLSWQLFKLLGQGDPLTLSMFIPAATSFQRLQGALREHGVAPELLAAAGAAYGEFEQVVSRFAGDRATFDSMTRGLDAENSSTQDVRYRKMIYQGYRHFFGNYLDTYLVAIIVKGGATPGTMDFASIRSKIGFHMLHPSSETVVDTMKMSSLEGKKDQQERFFFDPEAAEKYNSALLPTFCSQPLPAFTTQVASSGRTTTTISNDLLNSQTSTELVFGNYWKNVPMERHAGDDRLSFGSSILVPYPTRLLINDVLVHRESFPVVEESVEVYAHASPHVELKTLLEEGVRVPYQEQIVRLGRARKTMRIKSAPRYLELLEYCFDRLKWKMEQFDVYRLEIDYPIIDALPYLRFYVNNGSKEG